MRCVAMDCLGTPCVYGRGSEKTKKKILGSGWQYRPTVEYCATHSYVLDSLVTRYFYSKISEEEHSICQVMDQ